MALLALEGVVAGYVEGIDILNSLTLGVERGTVTGIIGPNGAGKSTLLKTIFGFLHPLSGGEAKMLSVAKELVTEPSLLLVDEPSAGLAPRIAEQVYERLREVQAAGVTILLVDQNITKAVEVSDYLYMLEIGRVRREGPRQAFADQLRELIRDALLGA